MLTPYKINAYCEEFKPEWACTMPVGCPPEDVLVPSEHPFFRLASQTDSYTVDDQILRRSRSSTKLGRKAPIGDGAITH